MISKIYKGQRGEAILLFIVFTVSPLGILIAGILRFPIKTFADLFSFIFISIFSYLLFRAGLVTARVLGTTLKVEEDRCEVQEWYGRRHILPNDAKAISSALVKVYIGKSVYLKLPDYIRSLTVGGQTVYVRFNENDNADELISIIVSILNKT